MKQYRVLADCSGFKTAASPRTKWSKGEIIWAQDREITPPEFELIKSAISPETFAGQVQSYSTLQAQQKEAAEPQTGFAGGHSKKKR